VSCGRIYPGTFHESTNKEKDMNQALEELAQRCANAGADDSRAEGSWKLAACAFKDGDLFSAGFLLGVIGTDASVDLARRCWVMQKQGRLPAGVSE